MAHELGYKTDVRTALTPESVGLSGDSAAAIRNIELLAEDNEQFLRVVFAQPRSPTAKVRNDLVRVLGKSNQDHLIILASDFESLEFVFLDKPKKQRQGPASVVQRQVVPKTISVSRRNPSRLDLRTLRRFTWTCQDALDQFDKLRSVFDAAAYTDTPDENPGACVVTALDNGLADWIIVTNGRSWRLFSRHAHARASNFYEVDLVEAFTASGDTDPNEAFRYWWLFIRPDAFRARETEVGCWLDEILQDSRDFAQRLGDRLKEPIFVSIFRCLAEGFLADARCLRRRICSD